jgi:RNA-directed DNA polymerase
MKLDTANIAKINDNFAKMQTVDDLLEVLNYTNSAVYGASAVQFTLQQLTLFASPERSNKFYKRFTIKKKSGADRQINAPVAQLKTIQKSLSIALQCVFKPSAAAFGFVWDKSIVDNAKKHVDSRYVYNVDLKDFFESIDQARVWKCLKLRPFNLVALEAIQLLRSKENRNIIEVLFKNGSAAKVSINKGFDENGDAVFLDDKNNLAPGWCIKKIRGENWIVQPLAAESVTSISYEVVRRYANREMLANLIAAICCTQLTVERLDENDSWQKVKRSVLPQGAPTSPVITNIVCQRLDQLLTGVANRFGLRYTRYADDITFSSQHNVYQRDGEFQRELHRIIKEQGFHIKDSKTRLQKDGYRKEVTGLLVNEKVNVQARYTKQLRMWLYYWEQYGYDKAHYLFTGQYKNDKGHVKNGEPSFIEVLRGKLEYLKMVKGENNPTYLSLDMRFKQLLRPRPLKVTMVGKDQYLDGILDLMFSVGVDKALDLYKPIDQLGSKRALRAENILLVLGITSDEELQAAKVKFRNNPEICSLLESVTIEKQDENKFTFEDVHTLIKRAKENVKKYLLNLPEYDCSLWHETSLTTVSGVFKNGHKVDLVIRPGDGGQIRLFYKEEFKILDNPSNELWFDTGDYQGIYTFGTYLQIAKVNQLPIKK